MCYGTGTSGTSAQHSKCNLWLSSSKTHSIFPFIRYRLIMTLRCLLGGFHLLLAASAAAAQDDVSKIFPFEYGVRNLDNGMQILAIDTNYKNLISLQIPVHVGSRDEIEPGLSGFAHFFEHMMFRGTPNISGDDFLAFYEGNGADLNAFTTNDYTNYHVTLSSINQLDEALYAESDRFKNLAFDEEAFKTEAGAVLGEYNRNYGSSPGGQLMKTLRDIAFTSHPYKHLTIGTLDDIIDMPNQYEFSKLFFERFYRPEYTQVIVTGDIDILDTLDRIERHFSDWNPPEIDYVHDVPQETALAGPVHEHIEWEATTNPLVAVAFRGPAFSDVDASMATIDAAIFYAFSSSSDIYKKLVLDEQKAATVSYSIPDAKDPYLLMVYAVAYSADDVAYLQAELVKTLASLRTQKVHSKRLADTVSYLRYSSASSLDSSESVADTLVHYLALTRDITTKEKVHKLYESVNPDAVQQISNKYFVDGTMAVVTLAGAGDLNPEKDLTLSIDTVVEEMAKELEERAEVSTTLLVTNAPLVDINILFRHGASNDPEGKEGLAKLTAQMLAYGGSTSMPYDQIKTALFPLAASLSVSVDKEQTTFRGKVHTDNLSKFYDIVEQQLLSPGFSQTDFDRLKTSTISSIEDSIRESPRSLLSGIFAETVYGGSAHPYGALTTGHVSSLKSITLEDVIKFYNEYYTVANIQIGLAGGVDDAFVKEIRSDFARLPSGDVNMFSAPLPDPIKASRAVIASRDIGKTSIRFGHAVDVTKNHPDFAALWVAKHYIGTSFVGRLFKSIREERGLSYGAYAYFGPGQNAGRQVNTWSIYISEVDDLDRAQFATRCALYEFKKMLDEGISESNFEFTRNSLLNSINQMSSTLSNELAIKMDMLHYYGIEEDFDAYFRSALESLTRDELNAAIKRHLSTDGLTYVFVTNEAEALRHRLISEATSEITYPVEKPSALLEEDVIIQDYKLSLTADNVDIVLASEAFEGEASETVEEETEVNEVYDLLNDSGVDEAPEATLPTSGDAEDGDSGVVQISETSESSSSVTVSETSESSSSVTVSGIVVGVIAGIIVTLIIVVAVGFIVYKRRTVNTKYVIKENEVEIPPEIDEASC